VRLVPIFVVGMPRSGSTLLEQMLAQVGVPSKRLGLSAFAATAAYFSISRGLKSDHVSPFCVGVHTCAWPEKHSAVAAAGEMPSLAVLSPRIFLDRKALPKGSSPGATFDPSVTSADMDSLANRFMATVEVRLLEIDAQT
jgi:hypothetical protein